MVLPADIEKRAGYRRNGLAVYAPPKPASTALLVLNMQNAWVAPEGPFRGFMPEDGAVYIARIRAAAAYLRAHGGQVIWLRTTTGAPGARDYWATYFDNFVGDEKRPPAIAALVAGSVGHAISPLFEIAAQDIVLDKFRFDAFLRTDLEAILRARGIDTIVACGTATNICCESTIRSGMQRDFRTFMPHDLVSAPTQDGHDAGLRSVAQSFADVRGSETIFPGLTVASQAPVPD